MNLKRRKQLRELSIRLEALRLELQILSEDEAASLLAANFGTLRGDVVADNYNELDAIQTELGSLRGRVDEIALTNRPRLRK